MDWRKSDTIAAAAFLAGAAVMGYESFDPVYQASGAGVAQDAVFYPRIVLAAIALLALVLGARAWLTVRAPEPAEPVAATATGRQTGETRNDTAFNWRFVLAIVAPTVAYAALIPVAGYLLATFLFVAVVPPLLGFRRWRALALTIVLFPLGSWLLFTRVIQIPLPTGALSLLG